jgi:hypothetical protein
MDQKVLYGLAANVTFRAEAVCGETVDILDGRFDFGTYIESCGNDCYVQIAVEKAGCTMALKNRYDQKVDIQKRTSFNNTTLLRQYLGIDFDLTLTPQKLQLSNEADTNLPISSVISADPNWLDSDGFNNYIGWIAPPLQHVTHESLGTFNASPIIELAGPLEGVSNRPPYPDFPNATGTAEIINSGVVCDFTDTVASFRCKGSADVTFSGAGAVGLAVKIFKLPVGLDGTVAINWIELYASPIVVRTTNGTTDFDLSDSVAIVLNQGDFIYYGISTRGDSINNISNFTLSFDVESFYEIKTSTECADSNCKVSLVNELGSRIIESISDLCLQMKSDYYGREDSEPYPNSFDGS